MTSPILPVTAVIVHYRTYDLTRMALLSLKSFYPWLPVIIIENHSNDGSRDKLTELALSLQSVKILSFDTNLHHGPGMDAGIRQSESEWTLVCDSDIIVYRGGIVESMLSSAKEESYTVGEGQWVDHDGFNTSENNPNAFYYIHPRFALVRKSLYLTLPPFEKHGAPSLTNQREAVRKGYGLVHTPVSEYVYHIGRGTARTEGYGLGFSGKVKKVKNIISRFF